MRSNQSLMLPFHIEIGVPAGQAPASGQTQNSIAIIISPFRGLRCLCIRKGQKNTSRRHYLPSVLGQLFYADVSTFAPMPSAICIA